MYFLCNLFFFIDMQSFSSSAVLHAAPPGIEAVKGVLNYVLHLKYISIH